ncbi:MAG: low affinity iron permease family protein [Actinomycetota bacterium]|nr:low affinity iron permease family protein [Actinomycetota bacterium]MDQ6947241.1 low affinity iron permease family protein [Actinomycetota bacterium]
MEAETGQDASEHIADDLGRGAAPFTRLAQRITLWAGSAAAAIEVVVALLVWISVGSLADFPHWREVSATVGLSFVTLLMVILIQHTQNHDDQAVQLKLDELIRANTDAANKMMRLEDASQDDLERIRQAFNRHAAG